MLKSRRLVDGDTLLGVAVVLLGVAVLVAASDYPGLPGGRVGPALFPRILAVCCLLSGGGLVVRPYPRAIAGSGTEEGLPVGVETEPPRRAMANALSMAGAVAFYVIASERIGFAPTAFIAAFLLMLRLGVRVRRALVTSVLLTAVIQLAFARALGVPLPSIF